MAKKLIINGVQVTEYNPKVNVYTYDVNNFSMGQAAKVLKQLNTDYNTVIPHVSFSLASDKVNGYIECRK